MTIYSFKPVYDSNSRVLILGSMASVKSLEKGFYYMHPQNKFWRVISQVANSPVPDSIEDKRQWLLDNRIALMDIIYSCERKGSLDSDIKNLMPNDIMQVLDKADIKAVFCNGRKSYDTAKKYYPEIKFNYLPSTSPANAGAWNIEPWLNITEYLQDGN